MSRAMFTWLNIIKNIQPTNFIFNIVRYLRLIWDRKITFRNIIVHFLPFIFNSSFNNSSVTARFGTGNMDWACSWRCTLRHFFVFLVLKCFLYSAIFPNKVTAFIINKTVAFILESPFSNNTTYNAINTILILINLSVEISQTFHFWFNFFYFFLIFGLKINFLLFFSFLEKVHSVWQIIS